MSEMLERVAHAIVEVACRKDYPLTSDAAVDFAEAVLKAMREPTDAMLVAVLRAERGHGNPAIIKQYWRTMIDEALR